jgi:hypothetical protein
MWAFHLVGSTSLWAQIICIHYGYVLVCSPNSSLLLSTMHNTWEFHQPMQSKWDWEYFLSSSIFDCCSAVWRALLDCVEQKCCLILGLSLIVKRYSPAKEYIRSLLLQNLLQSQCYGYGNLVCFQKTKSFFGFFFKIGWTPKNYCLGRISIFHHSCVPFVKMQILRISFTCSLHVTSVSVSGGT